VEEFEAQILFRSEAIKGVFLLKWLQKQQWSARKYGELGCC
jgi:hypothetical protein